MRIWAFPSFYPYDHPGLRWIGIFAHRQFRGLIDNGAELSVVQPVYWHPPAIFCNMHPDWKEAAELGYPEQRVYEGITVYHPRISNMKPSRIFTRSYRDRYIDAITGFFTKKKIKLDPATDIFYAQWLPDADMVQAAARQLGVRTAILMIGDDVLIWPKKDARSLKLFNRVLQQADKRLAVATYLGNEANKLAGKDLPFDTVRRGVNYDFFMPASEDQKAAYRKVYGIPANKIVILTIGSAIVRKGWLDLLDALQEIRKTNNTFVLVGVFAGSVEIDLAAEVAKRGLTEHFISLGEVDPKQINKLYNTADIFCLPSHWEGIANSVVEAMASGLPVITTNVCGHPELIENKVTGIMIPPKQPAMLADELAALISDAERRKHLGDSARSFIVNTWGNFADNAARLYQKLQNTLA